MENYSLYCHSCINYIEIYISCIYYIRKGWANQYWGEVKGGIYLKNKKASDKIITDSP